MNSSLAKRPASYMRDITRNVRDHSSAMARITDRYFAALKRAEAQYFDDIRNITDAITQSTEESAAAPLAQAHWKLCPPRWPVTSTTSPMK